MQPDSGDTTNALLVQLIQITVNGTNSVPDTSHLSSSMQYSSSAVRAHGIAYGGLLLSLFTAILAFLLKAFLNLKKRMERGTLEERGIRRQIILDGPGYLHMESLLIGFFILLEISLFLLCLSLFFNTQQQQTIAKVIVGTTEVTLFFVLVLMAPFLFHPDSPLKNSTSSRLACWMFIKSSAIR
ncbi:hypothetical protein BDR07DRAFT_1490104 [Suillus spraguei]|nr:hypothetical protein BDR07DRAFT_1490104 [Suillus spraguei]